MTAKLSVEDFSRLVHVGDPRVTRDGRFAAVSVVRPLLEDNKYLREIWVYDLEKGEAVAVLQSESDTSPRWSPDGKRLVFISRRGLKEGQEGENIYVYHVGGGEPRLVYYAKYGVSSVLWMPSGDTILAIARTPVRGLDKDKDYVDIRGLPVWFDGSGFIEEYRSHILLVDYYSGNAKWLTSGDYNVVYAKPSPNGKQIAALVSRNKLKPHVIEVVLYDAVTGEERVVVRGEYSFSALDWNPNSDAIILQGNDLRRGLASHDYLWLLELDTEKLECLTCEYGLNTRPAFSSDTAWPRGSFDPIWTTRDEIVFVMSDKCRVTIYGLRYGEMRVEPILEPGDYMVYGFSASIDGRVIVFSRTTPVEPGDVWVYLRDERVETRLTHFNEWITREVRLSKPSSLKIKASDGVEVEGWYLPPVETGSGGRDRYPVVLTIHGGPKSCYGPAFSFFHQLLAAKGYYVVYMNPRGSDGYDEEFADIRCHYGERDYMDIMEFLEKFLAKVKSADKERMAVQGISYGGFMVNWIVTRTDMFQAAISENGISDWTSDFWGSDIGYWFDPDQICGDPWRNKENYRRASPIEYVEKVKTPMLIIHSMEDYRCFIDQSLAMHVALQYLGKESRLVVFTKGSHGHSIRAKPRHRLKRYKIILEFLREKLSQQKDSTGD
jgi:acylaminoacyl-peptidase